MIRQLTPNSCGCACGQQLLEEEGVQVFQSNLTRGWYRGLTPKDLAGNLNRFSVGWKGGYLEGTREELMTLAARGKFIARLGGNPGHFVIVDQVADETLLIRDPADGSGYNMSVAEFIEIFSGAVWK
jgi:ABC-type bacteriocin/lantibiotic exporter with double-glycine peptidase domain